MRGYIVSIFAVFLLLFSTCILAGGTRAVRDSGKPKMRLHSIPGLIKFKTGKNWYQVGKKHYVNRRPTPDVLIFNKAYSGATIQFNVNKTSRSPVFVLKLIKVFSDPDIRWSEIVSEGGEKPAHIYFENDEKNKIGFIHTRHLPGRYSRLVVVGGGWYRKDHKKMTAKYYQIIRTIISNHKN